MKRVLSFQTNGNPMDIKMVCKCRVRGDVSALQRHCSKAVTESDNTLYNVTQIEHTPAHGSYKNRDPEPAR